MSIKASDLRIGNWYDHYGEFKQASPNTILEVWEADREWCKPIPLTPEVLVACGFTQLPNKFTFDKDKLSIHLPSVSYKKGRTYFNSWCIIEHSISHLHQLQNLYFALTNQELNYQP